MPSRILIKNGTIITFGKSCQAIEDQALLIEGDRIAKIAPKAEIQGPFDRVLDAKGKVVLPGLINAHMHFYSTFVRGLGKAAPSASFQEVLENLWWRLDKKLSMDDARFFIKVLKFKTDTWNEEMVADLKANQKILKKLGKIKTTPNLYDYIDNRFVKKAGGV